MVDFDDKAEARKWWRLHEDIVRVAVITRRGIHVYFSGETKTRKFPAGDIKGNGYVVYPPSTVDGHEYRFVPGRESGADLLPFPESLFPSCDSQVTHLTHRTREEIRRLDAYLAKIESKQGQHGSHGLVRAASVCRDAGLSESEATIKMLEWNSGPTVCPPWNHTGDSEGDYKSLQKEKCNVRKCSRPSVQNVHEFREWRNNLLVMSNGETNPFVLLAQKAVEEANQDLQTPPPHRTRERNEREADHRFHPERQHHHVTRRRKKCPKSTSPTNPVLSAEARN